MDFMIIIVIAVIVLVVGAIYSHKKEKERREMLRAWAASRNLSFQADRVGGFDDAHRDFDCLRSGQNRYAYNRVSGTLDGFAVTFFDYHYETTSTNSKGQQTTHHHHFSAVLVEPPFPTLPIVIRPEGMFDKVKAAFGWDDIDFESAEFSRRYFVKSSDKRWAYDVLHGNIMDLLLREQGYSFEGDGRHFLVRAGEKRFDLAQFEQAFRLVTTILGEIPKHAHERAAHHA